MTEKERLRTLTETLSRNELNTRRWAIGRLAELQERLALPAGSVPNVKQRPAMVNGRVAHLGELGLMVRIERRRAELTIRQAAAAIGLSPATLSRVERGGLPTLPHYVLVCRWLGIAPGDLLENLDGP